MAQIKQGDFVFIIPSKMAEFEAPIGGKILKVEKTRVRVLDDDNNNYWVDDLTKLIPMSSTEEYDDMIHLDDMSETSVLRNIQRRYQKNIIYTYTGNILVSVNPYKNLPIFDESAMALYRGKELSQQTPHIFAIANAAYSNVVDYLGDQCIIISGESGAGKTESTKLIIQCLAYLSNQKSEIEQNIIAANPLIEAFGNSKTLKNDNSSRFGKYIEISLDSRGIIKSAQIFHYLLEKTRICRQTEGESSYHIFYDILHGMSEDQKNSLFLSDPGKFNYLAASHCGEYKEQYQNVTTAMELLKIEKREEIFRLLAAILHIGNIPFDQHHRSLQVKDTEPLKKAAKILQINSSALELALTTCKIKAAQAETVVSQLSLIAAINVRDAFAKRIYYHLFDFLIGAINDALRHENRRRVSFNCSSVGILDIYGFESFETNSFEQLCINYANEKLHQFFINHVFKLEQAEYFNEGIDWSQIEFVDNQAVLDLLAEKQLSIFTLINEESIFPQGSDDSLLRKMNQTHSKNPRYFHSKSEADGFFAVKHFAGMIIYETQNFLEKNRDSFSRSIAEVVSASHDPFLRHLFRAEIGQLEDKTRPPCIARQFRRSLDNLIEMLAKANPFYIRCIKPNEYKMENNFCRQLCLKQLRYSGMLETIRIRKLGYPIRHKFCKFVSRFNVLLDRKFSRPYDKYDLEGLRIIVSDLCSGILPAENFQIGSRKIFLREEDYHLLEAKRREKLADSVLVIQKIVTSFLRRQNTRNFLKNLALLQKNIRDFTKRMDFVRNFDSLKENAVITLQSIIRAILAKKRNEARKYVKNSILLQSVVRAFIVRGKRWTLGDLTTLNTHFPSKSLSHDDLNVCREIWIVLLRYGGLESDPQVSPMLRKKRFIRHVTREVKEKFMNNTNDQSCEAKRWLNFAERPSSGLEKVQFVISNCLLRKAIRDVVVEQIMSLLKVAKNVEDKYWTILLLACSSFRPSDGVVEQLNNFLTKTGKDVSGLILRGLKSPPRRSRLFPPSLIELEAAERHSLPELTINIPGMNNIDMEAHYLVTSAEICAHVRDKLGLKSIDDFSLDIYCIGDASSLGNCDGFVFDAICRSEIFCWEQGIDMGGRNWSLVFKREILWGVDPSDPMALRVTYNQIMKHIKTNLDFNTEDAIAIISNDFFLLNGQTNLEDYVNGFSWLKSRNLSLREEIINSCRQPKQIDHNRLIETSVGTVHKNYPQLFSRRFECLECSIGDITHKNVVLAVNTSNLFLIDEFADVIFTLPYYIIESVAKSRGEQVPHECCSVKTLNGLAICFVSSIGFQIYDFVNKIYTKFKNESNYVLSGSDLLPALDSLTLYQLIDCSGDKLKDKCRGLNMLTNEREEINLQSCRVLAVSGNVHLPDVLLKEIMRFAPSHGDKSSGDLVGQPKNDNLEMENIEIYINSDFGTKIPLKLIQNIFGNAIKCSEIADNIYRLLINKIQNEDEANRLKQTWELLWLLAGLIGPSRKLFSAVISSIKLADHPLGALIVRRIKEISRNKPRKHPPISAEVISIRSGKTRLYHKISLPNNTTEVVEIESFTKTENIIGSIGNRLGLKSTSGYSVYVRSTDMVKNIPEDDYIFDFMGENGLVLSYQLFMLKKTWANYRFGEDPVADLKFCLPQEKQKYLLGYYRLDKTICHKMAALALRIDGVVPANPGDILQHANRILPKNFISHDLSFFRKTFEFYQKNRNLSLLETSVNFLEILSTFEFFNSAFIPIRMGEAELLVVNQRGVYFLNSDHAKIKTCPFGSFTWKTESTSLTIYHKGQSYRIEMPLIAKIDNLIMEYQSFSKLMN